jgi:hypothetical protein
MSPGSNIIAATENGAKTTKMPVPTAKNGLLHQRKDIYIELRAGKAAGLLAGGK